VNAKLLRVRPYEEIVELIAALSPKELIGFEPSEAARERVWDLLERQKSAPLSAEDKADLGHYVEVEHLLRLAKARARKMLAYGQRG